MPNRNHPLRTIKRLADTDGERPVALLDCHHYVSVNRQKRRTMRCHHCESVRTALNGVMTKLAPK